MRTGRMTTLLLLACLTAGGCADGEPAPPSERHTSEARLPNAPLPSLVAIRSHDDLLVLMGQVRGQLAELERLRVAITADFRTLASLTDPSDDEAQQLQRDVEAKEERAATISSSAAKQVEVATQAVRQNPPPATPFRDVLGGGAN